MCDLVRPVSDLFQPSQVVCGLLDPFAVRTIEVAVPGGMQRVGVAEAVQRRHRWCQGGAEVAAQRWRSDDA